MAAPPAPVFRQTNKAGSHTYDYWHPVPDAYFYKFYYNINDAGFFFVGNIMATPGLKPTDYEYLYIDYGPNPLAKYGVKITAVNVLGEESAYSNIIYFQRQNGWDLQETPLFNLNDWIPIAGPINIWTLSVSPGSSWVPTSKPVTAWS